MRTLYITSDEAKIKYRKGKLKINLPNGSTVPIPLRQIKEVIVTARVGFTSYALTRLIENKIPIHFISRNGKYRGSFINKTVTNVPLRLQQYNFYQNRHDTAISLAKQVVKAKVKNSYTLIRRLYNRRNLPYHDLKGSKRYVLRKLKIADSLDEIIGLEGFFSKQYFEKMADIIPKSWNFRGRNKRPPKDPVNAMLSLGYTILFQKMLSLLFLHDLEPFMGFLHRIKYNNPALSSDLMEEFRSVIVDSVVIELISKKVLHPIEDFEFSNKGVKLTRRALNKFIEKLEERFKTLYKVEDTPLKYEEILIKKVNSYIKVIKGETDKLFCFTIK